MPRYSPLHRCGCCRLETPQLTLTAPASECSMFYHWGHASHCAWGGCHRVKQVLLGQDGGAHVALAARR